jgi:hypothetical protein
MIPSSFNHENPRFFPPPLEKMSGIEKIMEEPQAKWRIHPVK